MEKVITMGFGAQGSKIVHNMQLENMAKIYVDSGYFDNKYEDGTYIFLPYEYELSAFSPEYPIKQWLTNEDNITLLENLLKEKEILVVGVGIGGEQSIVAKEMIRFVKKKYPKMKVCLFGSLPFRCETDYIVNCISRTMIDFIRNGNFAYSLVENEELLKYYQKFEDAYEISHLHISAMAEQTLKFMMSNEDEHFWKNPLYSLEFDIDANAEVPKLKNNFHPYNLAYGTALVEIELNKNLNGCNLHFLLNLYKEIENQVGNIDVTYKEGDQLGNVEETYKVRVLAMGKEDADRYMKCREINLYCIL